jgi:hypothetical protein
MIKIFRTLILTLLISTAFSGCIKDTCKSTYTIYKPILKSLSQVRMDMKSSQPVALEQTGKMFLYGSYIFLNEMNKGIHVIDNSNPAAPRNISFINIPGNVDLAVKGKYLYADSYADLLVFDISNPQQVQNPKVMEKVFPNRGGFYNGISSNPDSIQVIVGYNKKDTIMDCDTYEQWQRCANCMFTVQPASVNAAPAAGIGGSMARFTIVNDFLYTVTTHELFSFDLADAGHPRQVHKAALGNWGIETIYPFKNNLFIGSNSGMYIYNINNPAVPAYVSQFGHVSSCDPVIADDNHAYVTLRSGTECQGFTNQMEVLNITNISQPTLLKTYQLTNPHGLSKDGNLLFLCDGKDGLKVYDAANPNDIRMLHHIKNMTTFDVILHNKIAIVVASDGLYQFDYSNPSQIKSISKISINKT